MSTNRFTISHFLLWISLSFAVFLTGCISATHIQYNEEISDEVKGKSYGEVYFLSSTEDPRNLNWRLITEIASMGFNVKEMNREKPMEGLQGTGFFISNKGHILTCAHILDGSSTATVWWEGQRFEADSVASDKDSDLEILKLRLMPNEKIDPLHIDMVSGLNMGDSVRTIGYPMASILGDQARLTEGIVSALQGFMGSDKQFQITAPIQPGNSGGPVFDNAGQVRGIVTNTLNSLAIIESSGGAAPQNVNFALKPSYIKEFIDLNLGEDVSLATTSEERDIKSVKSAVVKVRSGIIPAHLEDKPKLVILFDYNSYFDLWYRFDLFLVSAFDFDTGEHLFTAGQVGDNVFSNEEVVIKDTLAKVKSALLK